MTETASALGASRVPNPGSDEAIKMGCWCPVLDNGHGKGYMGGARNENGETMFVYNCNCPVHSERPEGREWNPDLDWGLE